MNQSQYKDIITKWVADNFGQSEAEDPSWSIDALAEHLAGQAEKDSVLLHRLKNQTNLELEV